MCFRTFRTIVKIPPFPVIIGLQYKFTELSEESVSQILKPKMQFPEGREDTSHFKTDFIIHFYTFYNHRLTLVSQIIELDIPFKIEIWVILAIWTLSEQLTFVKILGKIAS